MVETALDLIKAIPFERAVLIAGPTASGKSTLALDIAKAQGRAVINADALQVFDGWRILTARPSPEDLAAVPHHLYGHVDYRERYSVGEWLREVLTHLSDRPPVIVGGTGLYFAALTEGLAEIPATDPAVRADAAAQLEARGLDALARDLDKDTLARIDRRNPVRVQRAWEVQRQTGRSLAAWHAATPPGLLPIDRTVPLYLDADREWLAARIEQRFDAMMAAGALDEARSMAADWDPDRLSSQAIGARELVAVCRGERSLDDAISQAKTATRQFAKRQRTWFRARMRNWTKISVRALTEN